MPDVPTRLMAVRSLRYNGASLQPGDQFEAASARDQRWLLAAGRAALVVAAVDDPARESAPDNPVPPAGATPAPRKVAKKAAK